MAGKKKVKRKAKKTFSVSIMDFVYLMYIIRLITGQTVRQIFEGFLSKSIKDSTIELAMSVLDRLEADGVTIAVEGSVVLFVKGWFKKMVGSKTLLKLGPLRIRA